jgi:hypothetical protein
MVAYLLSGRHPQKTPFRARAPEDGRYSCYTMYAWACRIR